MIVLDEQLLGRGIESAISEWYPGTVCFITELRPGTIIKDEAIPALLGQAQQPIFVTINVTDFWQRAELSAKYCLVCVALTDSQTEQIPELLRRLLRHPEFRTRTARRGKAVRLTSTQASWYLRENLVPQTLDNW
jgi:hypothetical protein